ncbi:MAG: VOC family protein [Oscillospiraceae bacterium]|nr:VOC family protein [Oscillospiraceae bacterium]
MNFLDKLVPRSHVGFVVEDVDAAVKNLQQTFECALDAEPYIFKPDKAWINGYPAGDIELKIAFCKISENVSFEYIQPVTQDGYHFMSLVERGDNLNHVCFVTDDLDYYREEFKKMGAPILFEAEVADPVRGRRRCLYTKLKGIPGVFEIQETAKPYCK